MPPSKADEIYEWIRDRIMSGEYPPRTPLNADELARQRGMSKIPIREALQRLTSEGLVHYRRNAGAVVAPLSWRELAGIRAARGALEPTAARLAATNRSEEQLTALDEQLSVLSDMLDLGQLIDFLEVNRQFHLLVAECSGLPLLAELIDRTLWKVNRYRAVMPISLEVARSDLADHRATLTDGEAGGEIDIILRTTRADARARSSA